MKAVYLVKQDSDAYQLAGLRLDCVTWVQRQCINVLHVNVQLQVHNMFFLLSAFNLPHPQSALWQVGCTLWQLDVFIMDICRSVDMSKRHGQAHSLMTWASEHPSVKREVALESLPCWTVYSDSLQCIHNLSSDMSFSSCASVCKTDKNMYWMMGERWVMA